MNKNAWLLILLKIGTFIILLAAIFGCQLDHTGTVTVEHKIEVSVLNDFFTDMCQYDVEPTVCSADMKKTFMNFLIRSSYDVQ